VSRRWQLVLAVVAVAGLALFWKELPALKHYIKIEMM